MVTEQALKLYKTTTTTIIIIIVFNEQLTNRNHNSIDWHAGQNNKA